MSSEKTNMKYFETSMQLAKTLIYNMPKEQFETEFDSDAVEVLQYCVFGIEPKKEETPKLDYKDIKYIE